jgi:hypothetical protein
MHYSALKAFWKIIGSKLSFTAFCIYSFVASLPSHRVAD